MKVKDMDNAKTTGIVRNMDGAGRLITPIEMRRELHLKPGDPVEFYLEGDTILIRKHDAKYSLGKLVKKFQEDLEQTECVAPELTHLLLRKVKEMQEILRKGNWV